MARSGGFSAAVACAGALFLVGAPTAGFALGAINATSVSQAVSGTLRSFTPASVDPQLARLVNDEAGKRGEMMRFTPAGSSGLPNRSVTVAVRMDGNSARLIQVRQGLGSLPASSASLSSQRLVPTRYDLGVKRGYQSFAGAPQLARNLNDAAIPDLAVFRPAPGAKEKPSRFNARIALDEQVKTGRSPQTRDSLGDQSVDLGGSYSLTRNLDVTAGVRYSQDRDRLAPIADGKQDSQAVYVGTQFRF